MGGTTFPRPRPWGGQLRGHTQVPDLSLGGAVSSTTMQPSYIEKVIYLLLTLQILPEESIPKCRAEQSIPNESSQYLPLFQPGHLLLPLQVDQQGTSGPPAILDE